MEEVSLEVLPAIQTTMEKPYHLTAMSFWSILITDWEHLGSFTLEIIECLMVNMNNIHYLRIYFEFNFRTYSHTFLTWLK